MLYKLLFFLLYFLGILLIVLVMLQKDSKDINMFGGSFNSGASNTFFGSSGVSSFMMRLIIGIMILFFIFSVVLGNLNNMRLKNSYNKNDISIMMRDIQIQDDNNTIIKN